MSWAEKVKENDRYACVACGNTSNLHAHHLYAVASYPQLREEVNNGVTLCKRCHIHFHKQYGKGQNTGKQFLTWLSSQKRTCISKLFKLQLRIGTLPDREPKRQITHDFMRLCNDFTFGCQQLGLDTEKAIWELLTMEINKQQNRPS